jgi:hypothetical protein
MSTELPKPIAAYFAASNAHDADACAACFTGDAFVLDENRERQGITAIRDWKAEVTTKYLPVVEIISLTRAGGRIVVTGRVSGNFPNSPVDLRYDFTLKGEKIARLEIHP